ncbi:ArsR family transcriptional regulator [Acidobacteria bacterium Mor1]|nr:ArsR family transcriptional regulator [Acidobacteria bacterium Mor1]
MERPATLLVVEDEQDILTLLEHLLQTEGFDVLTATCGEQAVEILDQTRPDLVLLDLMLPGLSGLEILKRVKAMEGAPPRVILLTARVEEVDRVLGFELGADDYVTKPFSPRELVLRVRSQLKRDQVTSQSPSGPRRIGPIEIDDDYHSVRVHGQQVELTLTEFKLLADLVRARGRVRTREALLSELWGYDAEVMSRTVDTHIRRLRRKLGPAASWLTTVRGVGYRFLDPEHRRT